MKSDPTLSANGKNRKTNLNKILSGGSAELLGNRMVMPSRGWQEASCSLEKLPAAHSRPTRTPWYTTRTFEKLVLELFFRSITCPILSFQGCTRGFCFQKCQHTKENLEKVQSKNSDETRTKLVQLGRQLSTTIPTLVAYSPRSRAESLHCN